MIEARRMAVSPSLGPDGVTHPTLVLMSNGVIHPLNGAGLPLRAAADDADSAILDWNTPRYTPTYNSTVARPDSDIGRDIKVTDWSNLADIKGHVLDGWGNVTPFGTGTTKLNLTTGYWPGYDIARAMVINPATNTGGFVLDYSGGMHRIGTQATTIAALTYFPGADLARDLVCRFNSPPGIDSGLMIDGWGGIQKFSTHTTDAWMDSGATPVYGGAYHTGWDIMRGIEFDFTTMDGFVLDGYGGVFAIGVGASKAGLGTLGNGPFVAGGPYWQGWDVAIDFVWPAPPTRYFVTLDRLGNTHTWNQFVIPAVAFTSPATTLTNTSRPSVTFTYGVGQNPGPGALSRVRIYVYPLAVTQQAGFRPGQGIGHVTGYSYDKSGILGTAAGGTYSVPFAGDLDNLATYVVYVNVTSAEDVSSGWVSRQFSTNYSPLTAPTLSAVEEPNNVTGARVRLNLSGLSGGQTWQVQSSDDGQFTWYDVFGAEATTTTPEYDYDAPFLRDRVYRAFRVTASPYLRSNPSSVVTVNLDLPTAGATWQFVYLDGFGGTIPLDAAAWTKHPRQPHEVHDAASETRGVVTSAGYKGHRGELLVHCWSQASHDSLETLLQSPQVVLLRSPFEHMYVWPGEADFQFRILGKEAGEVTPVRWAYDVTLPVVEVDRPRVVV